MIILDFFYILLFALLSPWLLYMLVAKPGFRAGLKARFVPPAELSGAPCTIWLHGASAGEVQLLQPLVRRIEDSAPDCRLVISAFAVSGYSVARKLYPQHTVSYFPVDFSPIVRRFLRVFDPQLVVLVESELWPNFIATAAAADKPVCVVNARISEKSFRAHRRIPLIPWALKKVTLLAAQSEEDAARFRELGVARDRLHVTGNMKYDQGDAGDDAASSVLCDRLRRRFGIGSDTPVLVAGSIHPGEDAALAWACRQLVEQGHDLRIVIVPRYPADTGEVCQQLRQQDFVPLQASGLGADAERILAEATRVLVVDTIGELKRFYAVADVAYVGGSLHFRGRNKGGHNLMEPALAGAAVLFGPYNYSFRETARVLTDNEAGVLVHDREELLRALDKLLSEPGSASAMGRRARQVMLERRGATAKNFAILSPLLPVAETRPERFESLQGA